MVQGIRRAMTATNERCAYYIERKKRKCGMTCKPNVSYCIEHLTLLNKTNECSGVDETVSSRLRVPCPLDPKHTVWESDLRKHLKKCNTLRLKRVNDHEPFYVKDCNMLASVAETEGHEDEDEGDDFVLKSIPVIRCIYENEYKQREIPLEPKSNGFMEGSRYNELVSNKKHAIQQSSLIQHLSDNNLLLNRSFIEFGCGRAELSRYINQVITSCCIEQQQLNSTPHFTLIDRGSNRMKFDKKFNDDYLRLSKGRTLPENASLTNRCKIDIKDLKLDSLLSKDTKQQYVAISKHLCGVATDLTLRCIENSEKLNQNAELSGLCIAMCCRHVCDPRQYINSDYIKNLLASHGYPNDCLDYTSFFTSLKKICSWATCGTNPGIKDDDVNNHFTKLPFIEREKLGQMARRIIDEGRAQWVRDHLINADYKVKLIKYVSSDVSLENIALIIHK